MDRRSFLRRTSIALAGGLVVGDAALELFERLTHTRSLFPSAAIPGYGESVIDTLTRYQVFLNKRFEVMTRRMAEDIVRMTLPNDKVLLGIIEIAEGRTDKFVIASPYCTWEINATRPARTAVRALT